MVSTYDEQDTKAADHVALIRGPIVLAEENRLGYNVDEPVDIKVNGDFVDAIIPVEDTAPYEHIVEVKVPLNNGGYIALTDYASAGKLWNEESKMAAWIKVVR